MGEEDGVIVRVTDTVAVVEGVRDADGVMEMVGETDGVSECVGVTLGVTLMVGVTDGVGDCEVRPDATQEKPALVWPVHEAGPYCAHCCKNAVLAPSGFRLTSLQGHIRERRTRRAHDPHDPQHIANMHQQQDHTQQLEAAVRQHRVYVRGHHRQAVVCEVEGAGAPAAQAQAQTRASSRSQGQVVQVVHRT